MIFSTLIILILFVSGCTNSSSSKDFNGNYKLHIGDYNSVKVEIDGVAILESIDKSIIENIIYEINTNKRELAQEMEFEIPPEGVITLTGEKEVEILLFKESGRTLYGPYYIHKDLIL